MSDDMDTQRAAIDRCIRAAVDASGGRLKEWEFGNVGGIHRAWSAQCLIASHGYPMHHPTFIGYGMTEDDAVADMARQVREWVGR